MGLTPDSVFCLKPEMGAGPPGEGWGGGAMTGCILIVCRYVDGLITGGGWLLSGGRGACKRKFTAVECHFQMSCQKYHPKIEVISSTVITCSIHCILADIYHARILRKGIRGNVMIYFVRSPAC